MDHEDLVAGDEGHLHDGEQEQHDERQDEGELDRRLSLFAPPDTEAGDGVGALLLL